MKNFTKVFSFILTLPLIIFFSIFTISNSNITYLSFWPLEQKLIMPIWALSITFFFLGLLFGCAIMKLTYIKKRLFK